jgi:hypothetical protein
MLPLQCSDGEYYQLRYAKKNMMAHQLLDGYLLFLTRMLDYSIIGHLAPSISHEFYGWIDRGGAV